ncbi:MAG: hypothetical protein J6V01_04935 [Clostridia bacterium]|nr:hypothetical protein [Clostridia bacterium]
MSCGLETGGEESLAVSRINYKDRVTAPDGTEYTTEVFTFQERLIPEDVNSKMIEKSGFRIVARDPETGEKFTPCGDPLCAHDCIGGCPLASRSAITYPELSGDCLLFRCSGTGTVTDEGFGEKMVTTHRMVSFNLKTRKSDIVYDFDTEIQPGVMSGGGYVFYAGPELEGEETVFPLVRYDVEKRKRKVLATFKTDTSVLLITDKRVYVGKNASACPHPEDAGVVSFTYNGKGRRDEPAFFEKIQLICDNVIVAKEPAYQSSVALGQWPRYIVYDIKTRKTARIPGDGWAVSVGFNPNDGRLYYLCCPTAFTVLGRTPESYADELVITLGQLMSDGEIMQKYEEEYLAALAGGEKTLRSCLPDGSDERIEYEFTEGGFFYSSSIVAPRAYMINSSTGSVSSDGTRYFFREEIPREKGQIDSRYGSIDLETGEIKYGEE